MNCYSADMSSVEWISDRGAIRLRRLPKLCARNMIFWQNIRNFMKRWYIHISRLYDDSQALRKELQLKTVFFWWKIIDFFKMKNHWFPLIFGHRMDQIQEFHCEFPWKSMIFTLLQLHVSQRPLGVSKQTWYVGPSSPRAYYLWWLKKSYGWRQSHRSR